MQIRCGRYAELHCTTNFSFLQGGSHPEELVVQAAALGYTAIAITDRASLSGVVRAHAAAKEVGVHLVIGAFVEPVDAAPLVLWATNKKGYANLCRLLTAGFMKQGCSRKYGGRNKSGLQNHGPRCLLTADEVATHAEGLLAGLPLARLLGSVELAAVSIREWQGRLGEKLYGLAEVAMEGDDQERFEKYARLSRQTHVPLVAAGDVRYHCRDRQPLHDVLAAVRHGMTIDSIQGELLSNGERHMQCVEQVVERFSMLPDAVDRTLEIASRCTFSLDDLHYEYPHAVVPAGRTPKDYLNDLAWKGARKRYLNRVPGKVAGLLEHELSLVH